MRLDLNLAVTSRLKAKKLLIICLNLEKGLKNISTKCRKMKVVGTSIERSS